MSDSTSIYGCDLSALLTNETLKINDNDEDFNNVLHSLRQISDSCNVGMKKEYKVVESKIKHKTNNKEKDTNCSSSKNHMRRNGLRKCGREGGYRNRFPTKLFKLLDESEARGHSHIISWLPHGRAFRIHEEEMFDLQVLNKYFKSSPESFKRQLYMYGFKKIGKRSPDCGTFFHNDFIRGEKDLCNTIRIWKKNTTDYRVKNVNFSQVPRVLQNVNKCFVRDN